MTIKALLIDSGKVLNGPRTGHWMISINFFDYVNKKGFYSFSKHQRQKAFADAMTYLSNITYMASLEEEVLHFTEYYKRFFSSLGMLIPEMNYELIAKDMVYTPEKYKFYKDVIKGIPFLHDKYDLGLVSDAWPSLNQVFEHADMKKYFKTFIVSTEIGFSKPNKEMYLKAFEPLGHKASECVFIDDRLKNCNGAKAVGINDTYLLCRNKLIYLYMKIKCKDHKVVRNFNQIIKDLERVNS